MRVGLTPAANTADTITVPASRLAGDDSVNWVLAHSKHTTVGMTCLRCGGRSDMIYMIISTPPCERSPKQYCDSDYNDMRDCCRTHGRYIRHAIDICRACVKATMGDAPLNWGHELVDEVGPVDYAPYMGAYRTLRETGVVEDMFTDAGYREWASGLEDLAAIDGVAVKIRVAWDHRYTWATVTVELDDRGDVRP
jgi:hypothetical protein